MTTTHFVSLNIAVSSDRNDLSEKEVHALAADRIREMVEDNSFLDALEWYDTEREGEEAQDAR